MIKNFFYLNIFFLFIVMNCSYANAIVFGHPKGNADKMDALYFSEDFNAVLTPKFQTMREINQFFSEPNILPKDFKLR